MLLDLISVANKKAIKISCLSVCLFVCLLFVCLFMGLKSENSTEAFVLLHSKTDHFDFKIYDFYVHIHKEANRYYYDRKSLFSLGRFNRSNKTH